MLHKKTAECEGKAHSLISCEGLRMRRSGCIAMAALALRIRPEVDILVGPGVDSRAVDHMVPDHMQVLGVKHHEVLHNQVAVLVGADSLLRTAVQQEHHRAVVVDTVPAFLLEVGHMLLEVGRMAGHLREPDNPPIQGLLGGWLLSYLRLCCHNCDRYSQGAT